MGWIDADGHPGHAFDHRNMAEVHHVSVRRVEGGFHATKTEDDPSISFAGKVFRCIQRFGERDAETAFKQNRISVLASQVF